jgi:hypothetical protein
MPISGPLTEEQQRMVEEAIRRKKEAAMGMLDMPSAGSPDDLSLPTPDPLNTPEDPLDAIVARKQRPDPLAPYDKRITEAREATPNMGQMLGAGFAGLGQAMTLGRQNYLDETLRGIDVGRQKDIKNAESAKSLYEEGDERNPQSSTSKEYQLLAAKFTGRKPEDVADLSAYDLKKTMPILEKMYKIETESKDRELKRTDYISEQQKQRDLLLALANKKADAASEAKDAKPTVGQNAVDKKFGSDYADFVGGGGYVNYKSQIEQLRDSLGTLDKIQASGPIVGSLPEGVRKRFMPEATNIQTNVESVVQGTLRQILGAQFTEREGRMILARAYDPLMPEEINKERVQRLLDKLDSALAAKNEAVKYFEENGTLKGFQGKLYAPGQLGSEYTSELPGGAMKEKGSAAGGLDPVKKKRLEELRAKKAAGTLGGQ